MTSGGYVGLSIATLLSQHHKVMAVDIVPEKVEVINSKKSPIQDEYIEKYLAEKELNLTATLDAKEAYSDADFVVIAAPTNYDSKKNFFDTSAVEAVIKLVIEYNPEAIMVIKSTIPVGFTASVREKYHCDNIIFSPEFLRESKALYDNLYPSRIIVGTDKERFWVTFDKEDARSLLEGEKVYPCYYPTNRSLKALVKNTKIAWDVLHKEKPDLIVSCGAAVAVPFFYIGKMMGAKVVYIEVFDRIDKPTMTGKMVYPIADKFVVQWDEQKKVYPKAVNLGSIF